MHRSHLDWTPWDSASQTTNAQMGSPSPHGKQGELWYGASCAHTHMQCLIWYWLWGSRGQWAPQLRRLKPPSMRSWPGRTMWPTWQSRHLECWGRSFMSLSLSWVDGSFGSQETLSPGVTWFSRSQSPWVMLPQCWGTVDQSTPFDS